MKLNKITLFLFAVSLLVSCATTKSRGYENGANMKFAIEGRADVYGMGNAIGKSKQLNQVPTSPAPSADDAGQVNRVVLYNADISIAVKSTDSIAERIEAHAMEMDGYTTNKSTTDITVRVPKDSLDAVLAFVSTLGRVDRKNIRGNDVTDQYVDFSIRLENAEKARKRYLELLAKAEDVKAALLVEKELERLNGLIDSYKGTLNRFDHLSEFSTVTVYIKEKKKPGVLGYIGLGLYHAVKWLFVRN